MVDVDRFYCPICNQKFLWKPEVAGKTVYCLCGSKIFCPEDPWGDAVLVEAKPTPEQLKAQKAAAAKAKKAAPKVQQAQPQTKTQPQAPAQSAEEDLNPLADLLSAAAVGSEVVPEELNDVGSGFGSLEEEGQSGSAGNSAFDLNLEDVAEPPMAAAGNTCPSCGNSTSPGAVICINCGFNLQQGQPTVTQTPKPGLFATLLANRAARDDDDEYIASEHRKQDIYYPAILIGLGVLLILINSFWLGPAASIAGYDPSEFPAEIIDDPQVDTPDASAPRDAREQFADESEFNLSSSDDPQPSTPAPPPASSATPELASSPFISSTLESEKRSSISFLVEATVRIVISMPFMLFGLFFVAKLFGSSYGTLTIALFKLLALVFVMVGSDMLMESLLDIITGGYGGLGGYITWAIALGLFFGLTYSLFQMDTNEALVMFVCVYILPAIVAGMAVIGLFAMLI